MEQAERGVLILRDFSKHIHEETSNLFMFNQNIRNIRTINVFGWKYTRVGKALMFVAKQGKHMGVAIVEFAPRNHNRQHEIENHPHDETTKRSPIKSLHKHDQADKTQEYKHEG